MSAEQIFGRGAKPDPKDPRDFAKARATAPARLPVRAETVNKPRIKNQGQFSSCTGHAVAWVWEQILKSRRAQIEELSPLYNWYFSRWASGYPDKDEGVYLREAMSALNKYGLCYLARWNYDRPISEAPGADAVVFGKALRLQRYERCLTPEDIKYSIGIEQQSVVLAIPIFQNWYGTKASKTGVVDMPGDEDQCVGWHAMAACGYDERLGTFKLANSWGPQWGDAGFCYVPYDALMWGFDAWTAANDVLPDHK